MTDNATFAVSSIGVRTAVSRMWIGCATVLAVTGMAQMPIAARYGIASIPGLAWTGDFHVTHVIHYLAAALLLALGGWLAVMWLAPRLLPAPHAGSTLQPPAATSPTPQHGTCCPPLALTTGGGVRLLLVVALVVTGAMRVAKNLPDVSFSPLFTQWVDWLHLAFAMLLGMASLWLFVRGRSAWLSARANTSCHRQV